MDFRLKVFATVAHHLSFTKASKELLISQPAVTKHVQELESAYNVQLFERKSSKIILTPAGQLFLKHTHEILAKYESLSNEMQLFSNDSCGEIRIDAGSSTLQELITPLLTDFTQRFPNVKVSFVNKNLEQGE